MIKIFSIILGFASAIAFSQSPIEETRPLKIGETVPDIIFNKIINYKSSTANLSDFQGKLIILDFWTPYCTVCIQQFPKLQSLQQKFGNKIQIISVGIEEISRSSGAYTLSSVIDRIKKTKYALHLPAVMESVLNYQENVFYKLFPWQSVPHCVWIDSNLTLRAVTEFTLVNEQNINSILNDKKKQLPERKLLKVLRPCDEDFLIKKNLTSSMSASAIVDFIDSMDFSVRLLDYLAISCDSINWHLTTVNQPIINTYISAYSIMNSFLSNSSTSKRVLVESRKMKDRLSPWGSITSRDGWQYDSIIQKNFVSYELFFPKVFAKGKLALKVISDLDAHFNLESKIEDKEVSCYILVGKGRGINRNQSLEIIENFGAQNDSLIVNNISSYDFVVWMNNNIKDDIIINGLTQDNVFNIANKLNNRADVNEWKSVLQKHGYDLVASKRKIPMLVLKDMQKNTLPRHSPSLTTAERQK